MPRKFSDFKDNCIAELLEQEFKLSQVAGTAGCGLTKVYKVRQNLQHFNTSTTPKLSAQGRLRKLTREMLDVSILLVILVLVVKTHCL